MLSGKPLWTLDELSAQVALALTSDYTGQANGRIREVPDRRTIRYYTTLGLIDRPADVRGRTALYGARHLLQLVAIKRLQSRGLALAEIQTRLLGLTDSALRELARLPEGLEAATPPPPRDPPSRGGDPMPRAEGRRDSAFWAQPPAAPAPEEEAAEARNRGLTPPARPASVRPLTGVALAAGVTLLLEAARPLDQLDVETLRAAAAPLLKLLQARRLLDTGGSTSFTKEEAS
jgi:DNA-binding transcriptional MerR regulator